MSSNFGKVLVVCTTDSMIWNFLIPHINYWIEKGIDVDIACSKTGFYFDEIEQLYQGHVFLIPFERFPFKKQNIQALKQLNKLIKSNNYSCIISQEPVGGVLGRIAGKMNHCKNVYTAHGFHFYKGAPLFNWICYYPIERFMSFFTDALITINEEDFNKAKSFHAGEKFKINGIGVDLEKFYHNDMNEKLLKKELGIDDDSFIILTVAELIERKNYETALKAIKEISDCNITYLICGDGVLTEKLKNQAVNYQISEKVKFLGFRKDVYKFYSIANMFLFPSYQEGLSVALIEAMAAGLPIICSDIRGNRDLIKHNKGGLLYLPTDYKGISQGIRFVMENQNDFGVFNKQFVQQFSLENAREEFYEIIQKYLK